MWILLAFISATLLGLYDTSKKYSLRGNDVIPVLFLNTLFCSLIFLPLILLSQYTNLLDGSLLHVGFGGWEMHRWIVLKSLIVLLSWVFGLLCYCSFASNNSRSHQRHTPCNDFGRGNGSLWRTSEWLAVAGVGLAILSVFLLAGSGKKEGIDFKHNRWIFFLVLAALMGTCSGLLDKFLMASPEDGGVGIYQEV